MKSARERFDGKPGMFGAGRIIAWYFVGVLLAGAVFYGGIAYVVIHFIRKFW